MKNHEIADEILNIVFTQQQMKMQDGDRITVRTDEEMESMLEEVSKLTLDSSPCDITNFGNFHSYSFMVRPLRILLLSNL